MIQYANYSEIQEIYIRPKDQYSSKVINNLTKICAPIGKGIIQGLDIQYSNDSGDVTIKKGVVVVDQTVIEFTTDITFNLFTELENEYMYDESGNQVYNTLSDAINNLGIEKIFLTIHYERDLNTPTKPAVFELRDQNTYNPNDKTVVMIYFWNVTITIQQIRY
jgi:hypothetical protein